MTLFTQYVSCIMNKQQENVLSQQPDPSTETQICTGYFKRSLQK